MSDQLRFDRPATPTQASRDADAERQFLDDVGRGCGAYTAHALRRIQAGDETYGDSFRWIGIRRLLDEILEEVVDVGAWSALADEALATESGMTEQQAAQIRATLRVAAGRAAEAYRVLAPVRQMLGARS